MRQQDRAGLGLRPFTCTWPGCSYAAVKQQNVDRHYLSHERKRPYQCTWSDCSYATTTQQQAAAMPRRGSST